MIRTSQGLRPIEDIVSWLKNENRDLVFGTESEEVFIRLSWVARKGQFVLTLAIIGDEPYVFRSYGLESMMERIPLDWERFRLEPHALDVDET